MSRASQPSVQDTPDRYGSRSTRRDPREVRIDSKKSHRVTGSECCQPPFSEVPPPFRRVTPRPWKQNPRLTRSEENGSPASFQRRAPKRSPLVVKCWIEPLCASGPVQTGLESREADGGARRGEPTPGAHEHTRKTRRRKDAKTSRRGRVGRSTRWLEGVDSSWTLATGRPNGLPRLDAAVTVVLDGPLSGAADLKGCPRRLGQRETVVMVRTGAKGSARG